MHLLSRMISHCRTQRSNTRASSGWSIHAGGLGRCARPPRVARAAPGSNIEFPDLGCVHEETVLTCGSHRGRVLVNEFDGSCRAFNVHKNDVDLGSIERNHAGYFAAVCGGMYLGPSKRVRNSVHAAARIMRCPAGLSWNRRIARMRRSPQRSNQCSVPRGRESSHRPQLLSPQPAPAAGE